MTNKDGDVAMLTGGTTITHNLDDLNTVTISADFERVVPLEGICVIRLLLVKVE